MLCEDLCGIIIDYIPCIFSFAVGIIDDQCGACFNLAMGYRLHNVFEGLVTSDLSVRFGYNRLQTVQCIIKQDLEAF